MTDEEKAMAQEMRDQGMFYREIGEALGFSWCAIRYNIDPTARQQGLDYRKENEVKIRERGADHYKANKEKMDRKSAEYYQAHKEKRNRDGAEYRKLHEASIKQYQLEYRQEHKAEARQNNIDYYQAHKQEIAKYVKDHSSEYAAHSAKRRALIAGSITGATASSLAEIKEIYRCAKEDSKVRCYLCGELISIGHRQVDHIVPISKGGAHCPSNLAIACDECNLRKSDKMPEEIGILI